MAKIALAAVLWMDTKIEVRLDANVGCWLMPRLSCVSDLLLREHQAAQDCESFGEHFFSLREG